jgi:hypothetical protein
MKYERPPARGGHGKVKRGAGTDTENRGAVDAGDFRFIRGENKTAFAPIRFIVDSLSPARGCNEHCEENEDAAVQLSPLIFMHYDIQSRLHHP